MYSALLVDLTHLSIVCNAVLGLILLFCMSINAKKKKKKIYVVVFFREILVIPKIGRFLVQNQHPEPFSKSLNQIFLKLYLMTGIKKLVKVLVLDI